jgi:hypothetical protein
MTLFRLLESTDMSKIANSSTKAENASVTGLEELFINTADQARINSHSTQDQAWTLTEAANAYNVTERTIRRWIKEQVVSAWKVDGPRGPEWRINSGSTMDRNLVYPGSTVDLETTILPEQNASILEADRLWDLLKEKDAKIEALIMRTGYLQAQIENKEEHIKLLTDSQHKPSWLHRLKTLFSKDKK